MHQLYEMYEQPFIEWVNETQYDKACDYCCDLPLHQDDDFEQIQEKYFESLSEEEKDKLFTQFINTKG